jgi:hypothetical protein
MRIKFLVKSTLLRTTRKKGALPSPFGAFRHTHALPHKKKKNGTAPSRYPLLQLPATRLQSPLVSKRKRERNPSRRAKSTPTPARCDKNVFWDIPRRPFLVAVLNCAAFLKGGRACTVIGCVERPLRHPRLPFFYEGKRRRVLKSEMLEEDCCGKEKSREFFMYFAPSRQRDAAIV